MTTNLDEYLHPRDIRDSHVLTRIIEKRAREYDLYDVPFCPLRQTNYRKVKVKVRDFDPAGLAGFKADNANTPIVGGTTETRDIYMELVTIGEKHVLNATDLIALESPDPAVAEGAARDILELGRQLRVRNVQRTIWMAWQAAQDSLSITYPDGVSITLDYDLNASGDNSDFTASHLPTASTAWSTASADIITDIYNWSNYIEIDLGVNQADCILHVNSFDWRYMKSNTGIRNELSSYQPRVITPTPAETAEVLGIAGVVVYNKFWRDTDDTRYNFLPNGSALLTGPYTVNGIPIMEMYDGPVVRAVGEDLVVASNPGAQAEIYINKEQASKHLRVQTARIPVMNYPAAFVWADIGTS